MTLYHIRTSSVSSDMWWANEVEAGQNLTWGYYSWQEHKLKNNHDKNVLNMAALNLQVTSDIAKI